MHEFPFYLLVLAVYVIHYFFLEYRGLNITHLETNINPPTAPHWLSQPRQHGTMTQIQFYFCNKTLRNHFLPGLVTMPKRKENNNIKTASKGTQFSRGDLVQI